MSRSTRQAVVGLGILAAVLVAIAVIATVGAGERELRADVLSTRRSEPGELVVVTISTRDSFGVVTAVDVDFGDGTKAAPVRREVAACASEFAKSASFDFDHTYERRGVFTVRATVTSEGCGATREQVTAIRTIDVKPLRRS